MAATPTRMSVVILNPQTKQRIVRTGLITDVNSAETTWEDGGDFLILPAGFTVITDISTASAVVDTSYSTINVNSVTIPRIMAHNSCLGTIVGRPFQQVPLIVPSGSTLEFTNVT